MKLLLMEFDKPTNVLIGGCAGVITWLWNAELSKAAAVALFCGVLAGIGRVAGQWIASRTARWWNERKAGK